MRLPQPLPGDRAPDAFYDDPDCQRMFHAFLGAIVQRMNSLTGVAYRCGQHSAWLPGCRSCAGSPGAAQNNTHRRPIHSGRLRLPNLKYRRSALQSAGTPPPPPPPPPPSSPRDDPTILAWSLANEPRCAGDPGCTTIPRWAHSTAAYLKSLDPNHMVTLVSGGGALGPQ